jgi:hypothetical protein
MTARPLPCHLWPGGTTSRLVRISLLSLTCALGVFVDGSRSALAGQTQTIPSQTQPEISPPPPITRQPGSFPSPANPVMPGQGNTREIPPPAPAPVLPLPGQTREIPLPEVFRGCWTGQVADVDSIQPLRYGTGRPVWLTKSYTLCYKQVGNSDRWHLTFAESSVSDPSEVSDQRQSIKVKSISGPDRAELTAFLHFRAAQGDILGLLTGATQVVDELTTLDCTIAPDHSVMSVNASVFVEDNNAPTFRVIWHTRFLRSGASAALNP